MPCRIWPIFNQDLKEENRHASRIQPQSLRTTPLHSPPITQRSIPLLFVRVGVGLTRLGSAYPLITPLAYPARRGMTHTCGAAHAMTPAIVPTHIAPRMPPYYARPRIQSATATQRTTGHDTRTRSSDDLHTKAPPTRSRCYVIASPLHTQPAANRFTLGSVWRSMPA